MGLVGLAGKRHGYARPLSFGQQKLLELARMLVRDPALVLLDGPAAGVNPTLLKEVLALVRRLRDEQGTTFLVVEAQQYLGRRALASGSSARVAGGVPSAAWSGYGGPASGERKAAGAWAGFRPVARWEDRYLLVSI